MSVLHDIRSPDWSQWSAQQINCLECLDFAVPLHQTHITGRYRVHINTLMSCVRHGLARHNYLYEENPIAPIPFFTLTQYGERVKRDWINWNKRVGNKIRRIVGEESCTSSSTD